MADIEKPVLSEITGEFFDRVVAPAEIGRKARSGLQCGTCTASCPAARFTSRSHCESPMRRAAAQSMSISERSLLRTLQWGQVFHDPIVNP